jgi:hypothetical protein
MPVRRSAVYQVGQPRTTVATSLMPMVDDQSADPEAGVCWVDSPHHEPDDIVPHPNGEWLPWAASVGTQGQVVGDRRDEVLL